MEDFPPNETASKLADGLAEAHKAYNNPKYVHPYQMWPSVLTVLIGHGSCSWCFQASETCSTSAGSNTSSGRGEQKSPPTVLQPTHVLTVRHAIHVIRRTFDDLATSATLHPTTHALSLDPFPPSSSRIEISTVYFRVGFVPTDFPTPTHYVTRILLERSRAIKCPSIALQLAGGKKVQQVLTRPGMLERFLCDERRWGRGRVFGAEEVEEVRGSWVGMWGLDEQRYDEGGVGSGVDRARSGAMNLVLKPQREGGGNNVYKGAIPAFLDALPASERRAWIAMELIRPPRNTENYLLRASPEGAVKTKVVNELGVFGWALFGAEGEVTEGGAGWLVRTKNEGSDEGGVVAGFSVLDSVVLVDV
jgi:glutathione synthetase